MVDYYLRYIKSSAKYALTEEEFNTLSDDSKRKYSEAISCCNSENAGGWHGWAEGHERLVELGWESKSRSEGHRMFMSLVKPESLEGLI